MEPLITKSRRAPVFCTAWMMLRVLSWRSVDGPVPGGATPESTASASATAGLIAAGSVTSGAGDDLQPLVGGDGQAGRVAHHRGD